MQIIQYKLENSNHTSKVGLEKTKITQGISAQDLMGLSWIFLDEDFTSQFNGGKLNCQ